MCISVLELRVRAKVTAQYFWTALICLIWDLTLRCCAYKNKKPHEAQKWFIPSKDSTCLFSSGTNWGWFDEMHWLFLFFYLSFVPSRRHGNDKRRKPLSWWKELWKKSKTRKVKKKFSIFFSVFVHEGRDPRRCSRRPENKGMGSRCKPVLWTQSLDHRRRKNLKHLIKDIICDTFGRPAGKWWQNVDFYDNSVEVIEFLLCGLWVLWDNL